MHILTLGDSPWTQKQYVKYLRVNAFFLGNDSRHAVARGYADYTPCFLNEVPGLFYQRVVPLDVAFIEVSPPDKYGYCSLGVSVDVVYAAVKSAKYVIAQINDQMPRTFGNSFIHIDGIDAGVEVSHPIAQHQCEALDDVSLQIGKYCSLLIDDGCTLQMGIGNIPNAVLYNLKNHNDLGVHTEMFSNGLLDLYNSGNITNKYKTIHAGKTITSFCFGNKNLYDFVDNNPHIEFHPTEYVNNPVTIAKNDKMISINSAIEVDLTGQVVSDSIGHRFYSGIGGQVDFIRGAGMSKDGKPIIALPSTAQNGKISKIVPHMSEGAGVVTSRGDAHYVVTEYGIATLRGRSIRERVMELIQIAHPKFRDSLLDQVQKSYTVPEYQHNTPLSIPELGNIQLEKVICNKETYILRPIQPSDQNRIQDFFYSHKKETLYQRYRFTPKAMGIDKAYALVNVNQVDELALCIVQRQGPREIIVGIGRYFYEETSNSAEVAFVVAETLQRHGIGSVLLSRIIDIANKRKLTYIKAMVRIDNIPMQCTLKKFGFIKEATPDPAELMFKLSIN